MRCSSADHAVTSLARLSLVPEFRRGHGALYDALAAGRIDEEALAALLTQTLPPLADGDEGHAWVAEHDRIDYGLLEQALVGMPAADAAQVREACARWRLRFGVDATPYPRPDAGCSPERGHVHHDACRCDSTRKTIPAGNTSSPPRSGTCAPHGAALVDVERTTPATRTRQTARQVKNLLRRLQAADGAGGRGAPLVILDAGSRTYAELAAVAVGLPAEPTAAQPPKPARAEGEQPVLRPGPVIMAATALCAGVWAFTFLPPWPTNSDGDPPAPIIMLFFSTNLMRIIENSIQRNIGRWPRGRNQETC